MKGQILVVDDLKKFDLSNVVYATNSYDAIALLKKDMEWDEIWLDHDLGYDPRHGFNDINAVLFWLEENGFFNAEDFKLMKTKIRIISYNPVGRTKIWAALHKWYDVDTNDDWERFLTEA